jgi:hypothetical protein
MIAAVASSAGFMGCGPSHSFQYVGQWEAHRELPKQAGVDPEIAYQASRVVLTIKSDGTFDLVDAGYPHGGNFEVDGDHAVLTITSVMGQPMDRQDAATQAQNKPIRLTPEPDGKTLRYFDPGGFDQTGLIMKRVTLDTGKAKG